MNDAQDLYAILGVPAKASVDDIRRAYRDVTERLHPNRNPEPAAAAQFRDITAAYEVLANEESRRKYDARRKATPPKQFMSLRVTPSKEVLPAIRESQVLYLLLELKPNSPDRAKGDQTHLNLTLVLDHSTSMKEEKRLDRTKSAAYKIIDSLTPLDFLSVIAFSDHAEVLIEADKVTDRNVMYGPIMAIQPFGGTEIFQGLEAAYRENHRNASPRLVNHIILITDGRTFGDEQACLDLAEQAAKDGIGISAMGIGHEWNDVFLDQLVARSGGACEFISASSQVVKFMNDRVRSLGKTFAERIVISLAPDPDIKIESVFRLSPDPRPLPTDKDPIALGQMAAMGSISLIVQLQIPPSQPVGKRSLVRIDVTSDILLEQALAHKTMADIFGEFADAPVEKDPPLMILDALGKLTLYRMQDKAQEALARGDVYEATRKLEALATRLISAGQDELAQAAMTEAVRVAQTHEFSATGQKTLKFGTRLLLAGPQDGVGDSNS
ncbi:MAG TPA: DnaJ domain-containing protein [Aggregatilineales bacterium]|nr:DnaJ domain-containing protein [Aggregatilineales bacterium]